MKTFFRILFFFLLVTQICFAQWYQQTSGTTANLNAVQFIDANNGCAVGDSGIILKTNNSGNSWTSIATGITNDISDLCFPDANNGWAVTGDKYDIYHLFDTSIVLYTPDGGITWTTQLKVPLSRLSDVTFINVNTGFVVGAGIDSLGHFGSLFLQTTNGGSTWNQQIIDTIRTLTNVYFTDANNGWISDEWWGMESGQERGIEKKLSSAANIYRTTNGGSTWYHQFEFGDITIGEIYFTDLSNGIVIGTKWFGGWFDAGAIGKTFDGGENWTFQILSGPEPCEDLILHDLFILNDSMAVVLGNPCSLGTRFFWTIDGGTNWTFRQSGMDFKINRLFFADEFTGWAVGDSGTILHTTNGGVTFIEEDENNLSHPTEFALSQNYPNPFNPSTIISYQLPVSGKATLKVYDVLGNEIATLVDEEKLAGTYEFEFKSKVGSHQLASGIYYYQLRLNPFVETKKMMVLK